MNINVKIQFHFKCEQKVTDVTLKFTFILQYFCSDVYIHV